MNIEFIPLFSFVFVTTFTPGPNNISSASMGLVFGYRKTLNFILGIVLGFFCAMIFCACFSRFILRVFPVAEMYLKWIGAGYILWLAAANLKSDFFIPDSNQSQNSFAKGLGLQLFNPKVAVFGVTLYSTFLASVSSHFYYLIFSAACFTFATFLSTSAWALFGAAVKKYFKNDIVKKSINAFLSLLLVYTAVEISGVLEMF